MNALYRTIVRWTLHRQRWLVIGLVAVTAILGFFAATIDVKTNFKDLLGDNRPVMVTYDRLLENYPDASAIFVVIEGDSASDIVAAGDALAATLDADTEWIRDVRWQENMEFFRQYALLLEETDQLTKLRDDVDSHPNLFVDSFAGYSLTNLVRGMNASFGDYDNVSSVKEDEDDLIRGIGHTGAWLESLSRGFSGDVSTFALERTLTDVLADPEDDDFIRFVDDEGHMISPDGKVGLLQVIGQGDANDAIYGTLITNHLRDVCSDVGASFPNVRMGLTGFPVVLADEGEAMQQGMALGFVLAIVGILLVFFVAFRRIVLPSLAAIPLLIGVLWSIGLVALTIGELNMFSLMAPVILLGLGIDYSIHILAQFTQSRSAGRSLEAALQDVFQRIGRGLFIGAMTTALTFFAVVAAGFKGINDFGIVGGISVLSAFAAMILSLPLILVWVDRRRTRRGKKTVDVPLPLIGSAATWFAKRRVFVLIGLLLVLAGSGFLVSRLQLETDVMKIEPKGLESIRLQELVLDSFDFSIYTTFAMLNNLDAVQDATAELEALPTVKRVDSLATFLPSDSVQETRRELIVGIAPALRAAAPDPDQAIGATELASQLNELADQLFQVKTLAYMGGMTRLVDEIEGVESTLQATVETLGTATSDDLERTNAIIYAKMQREYESMIASLDHLTLTRGDVPADYLSRYVGSDGSYLLTIYPTGSPWLGGFGEEHQHEIASVIEAPTGTVPIWNEVLERMIPGFLRAAAVALAVLAVLLLLDLRSVRQTILILIPLLVSLFLTLALIPAMGMKVNVVNIMAFPLILGIGIDDGVHLFHRYRVERDIRKTFSATGKAILTTTLTTVMAMLTLTLSPHRGMISFGVVASVGIALCLILNLLLLPGLIRTFDRSGSHIKQSTRRTT